TRSAFPWSSGQLAKRLRAATREYWSHRALQSQKQVAKGSTRDVGTRNEVTGGQHLNGFVTLVCELVMAAGYESDHVRFKTGVDLPGYYRPMKKWDIVVIRNGRLCAAVELKSQVGPS